MTLQQKYKLWLESRGWSQEQCKSTKYIQMGHPDKSIKYLLGKAGAFRRTRDTISNSVAIVVNKENFELFCAGLKK